jgi:hypothetical protein
VLAATDSGIRRYAPISLHGVRIWLGVGIVVLARIPYGDTRLPSRLVEPEDTPHTPRVQQRERRKPYTLRIVTAVHRSMCLLGGSQRRGYRFGTPDQKNQRRTMQTKGSSSGTGYMGLGNSYEDQEPVSPDHALVMLLKDVELAF